MLSKTTDEDSLSDLNLNSLSSNRLSRSDSNINKYAHDALSLAIENGHIDIVNYLITEGVDIDSNSVGVAAINGQLEMVKYLTEHGLNIQEADDLLLKLRLVIENRHFEVFKYLLDNMHENVDYIIRWCFANEFLDVIKFLEEKCDSKQLPSNNIYRESESILIFSAINGHLETVKFSIEKGMSVHMQNKALINAAVNGHLEIVIYLIEKGANIHVNNDQPLIDASYNGHLEIVKYLIEHGADIKVIDRRLIRTMIKDGHIKVVRYLKEQGLKMNLADKFYALYYK